MKNLGIHQNLIHIKRLEPSQALPWKVSFLNHVAGFGEVDDVVDTPVERLPTVRVGENLWIPFVGAAIRGKDNVTHKELTEPAFGMDLSGVPIASLQKGSIAPISIEIVNEQRLVLIGTIVPEEVRRTLPAKSRKLVNRRGQHGVTSFSSLWFTVKD